jgi:ribonucleoside-diphosphate reductase alpha chain
MAIGIQGLADVFFKMRYPFDSQEARLLNKKITEHIYYAAIETSIKLCLIPTSNNQIHNIFNPSFFRDLDNGKFKMSDIILGSKPYETFKGSKLSKGIFNFDSWNNINPNMNVVNDKWKYNSDKYHGEELNYMKQLNENDPELDWNLLRKYLVMYGIKNSLLLGFMPTAGTSQILGYTESFEPITSNMYKRKTLAGEFIIVNKYLVHDLNELGLWNQEMKDLIIINDGSIQNIESIPINIKQRYKTVWEIKQKHLLEMSIDRSRYICQSQSLNIFMDDPTYDKLTSVHFYGWENKLKTGLYYLRTKSKSKVQKFTVDPNLYKAKSQEIKDKEITEKEVKENETKKDSKERKYECTDDVCISCSS